MRLVMGAGRVALLDYNMGDLTAAFVRDCGMLRQTILIINRYKNKSKKVEFVS
jgi:hypothetical protein